MTTYNPDPQHGTIETVASVAGALELIIRTTVTNGVPTGYTVIRDRWMSRAEDTNGPTDRRGLTGRLSTSALQAFGDKLIEHAAAVEQFTRTYEPASWSIDEVPVEVYPGFPLTMTTEAHVHLAWPDGVRARDEDGDVWVQRTGHGWRLGDGAAGDLALNLPATIIPTSWPKPADTTPEN